jgi:hypothetical protein
MTAACVNISEEALNVANVWNRTGISRADALGLT